MLLYETAIPTDVRDGARVFVLLHGRGSHMGDLMGLAPYLPQDSIVVAPQAPFSGSAWGYGPGWAWYRFLGGNRPEPESFATSQEQLHQFLQELPAKLPVKLGPLVLGGFSQGGTMSLGYALANPGQVSHLINFSGFLPDHPSVQATAATVAGTRFFWGHGTADPAIPFALAEEGRAALQAVGADLTLGTYRMGHQISGEELQDLLTWLDAPAHKA